MKELKKDLQEVSKSLKQLTRKTEQIAKRLDRLGKAQASKKPKAKPAKKAVVKKETKVTAIGTVLGVISRSNKGVTTAQIKKKTGLAEKKIWYAVNRLKREGKVKSAGRGIYATA